MSVIDDYKFRKGGAVGCSQSYFLLKQTTCCGKQCVQDDELWELYWDPSDLSGPKSLLHRENEPGLSCPFCLAKDWNLREITDLNGVSSDWRWATIER
jgi:hypothetical protein